MEYYCFSVPKLCLTLCDFMYCSMPGSSVLHCLLFKFMSIELVMLSNHLILCHPLLLLPSVFSSIKVFSNASSLHIRWPRNWRFNFSNSPSSKYSGFISFRIDRFDLQSIIKEYYSDIKKKKIMHQMGETRDCHISGEVSQTQNSKCHMILLIYGILKKIIIYKTEK